MILSPALLFVALVIVGDGIRKRRGAGFVLVQLVLLGYLAAVAGVTLFPIDTDAYFIEQMRLHNRVGDGVNLVPFVALAAVGDAGLDAGRQMILNLALGIPLGFLLPFLGASNPRSAVLCGAGFAAAIELVQFALDLVYGFGYRVVDVNDFLSNWLGVALGVGGFRLLRIVYRRLELTETAMGSWMHRVMTA